MPSGLSLGLCSLQSQSWGLKRIWSFFFDQRLNEALDFKTERSERQSEAKDN